MRSINDTRDFLILCTLFRAISRPTNRSLRGISFDSMRLGAGQAPSRPVSDDQVRMLQQDPRVQPSSLRRRLSPVLVCSSHLLRLNTFSQCWCVLCKCHLQHRARHPHYRSNHSSTVKQTLVVHLMKLTAPRKNLDGTKHVSLFIDSRLTTSTLFTRFRLEWERFESAVSFTGQPGRRYMEGCSICSLLLLVSRYVVFVWR